LLSRVDALNAERLPTAGPAIIAVQHTALMDVPVVLSVLAAQGIVAAPPCRTPCRHRGHVRVLAIAELWNYPVMRAMVHAAGVIPVHRQDLRGVEAYQAAASALRRGEVLLLYPEGNVQADASGAPRRVRSGAVRLAREHDAPLVPVAHCDVRVLGDSSVRGSLVRSARALFTQPRVVVAVGPPVPPSALARMTTAGGRQLLRDRLTSEWRRAAAALTAGASNRSRDSGSVAEDAGGFGRP
jgi:1-acyl-sn-glycerol-3-phosphate acyltransferase